MSELKRHMGLFHLTMYGVGLILGAGIIFYLLYNRWIKKSDLLK